MRRIVRIGSKGKRAEVRAKAPEESMGGLDSPAEVIRASIPPASRRGWVYLAHQKVAVAVPPGRK